MKKELAGSLYLMVVGLLIAGSGVVFTWLLGSSFERAKGMDDWQQVDCTILESKVNQRQIGVAVPIDYSLRVLYGYEFEEQPYSSESFDLRGNAWVKDATKIQQLVNAFPAGSLSKCWVNPRQPQQAVLKKETKAPGYSIWFPLLFVIGGFGIALKAALGLRA